MSESSLLWLAGVAVMVILGLLGLVYRTLHARDDRAETRLDEHIGEDVKAHERLARVETQVDTNTGEVKSLRDRTHKLEADSAYQRFIDKHKDG